ncbi:thiol:disulfide interchange protein [Leifsonia xyli subsp. cynodontis DSM 46306]|jgi:thiol-disulfide isomerase/thioredoxin|uniref:Thioredoxin domain-containing protein n=1 Tax=Leifsonia xyli subsp. cynodontis DSM 46306 TaxID=1389489 RepID=U3PFW4_LEIXC|nr:TlpA disulfide reductase family protein [Leifsonia xyli]AGW42558.1 thiol:disulfide interchange protein [Leifsonia xyli subsp. cynodontis DSM 46306]
MSPRPRLRRALPAVAVVAALLLAGCSSNDSLAAQYRSGSGQGYIAGDGSVSEYPSDKRGEPVRFQGKLADGAAVSSKDYAGRVLVVNFWYAGCPPCRLEAPDLEALSRKHASDGVEFLGVNLYDSASTAASFEKDKGVTYPSVLDRDTGSVLLAFSNAVPPKATPTTLVIDKKGRVAARILGGLPDRSILDSLISDAVAEN